MTGTSWWRVRCQADPDRALASAVELHIAPDRAYRGFEEMAEKEAQRPDRIDVVAVVTPNHMHAAPVLAFARQGIHVICDKPLAHRLEDALDMADAVRRAGIVFGLTHNYTGTPMVRQAREMVAAGDLGKVRVVQVEYPQDWLTTRLEETGQKQAAWRTDPARAGAAGCVGDLGSHAFNLAEFVSGLRCESLAADLSTFVPGRALDDNAHMLLRFAGGARGVLWASQVAPGNENALRLRVYGEKGGLEWAQEQPNVLLHAPFGEAPRTIRRAGGGASPVAAHASRLRLAIRRGIWKPSRSFIVTWPNRSRPALTDASPIRPVCWCLASRTELRGMRFIAAAVESGRRDAAWTAIER